MNKRHYEGKRNLGITVIAGAVTILVAMVAINLVISGLTNIDRITAFITLVFVAFISFAVAVNGHTKTLGELMRILWFMP